MKNFNLLSLTNVFYLDLKELYRFIDPDEELPLHFNEILITYNSEDQLNSNIINTFDQTIIPIKLSRLLQIDLRHSFYITSLYLQNAKKLKELNFLKGRNLILIDKDVIINNF